MPTLKDHEIAEVFPLLDANRLQSLADSIKANDGLLHPIVLFEEKILDGRNRYRAAKLASYQTRPQDFVDFVGTWEAAVRYVAAANLERRHLTNNERSFAAERLATLAEGRPKTGAIAPVSQAAAAEMLGTSRDSVKRARVVRERGVPELVEAAQSNQVAVSAAAELTKLPPEEQKAALAAGPETVAEAVREIRQRTRPAVHVGASAEHQRARRAAAGFDVVGRLVMLVRAVEEVAGHLAADRAAVPAAHAETAAMAVERLRGGVDWIAALVSGSGVSDEALREWMAGGAQ